MRYITKAASVSTVAMFALSSVVLATEPVYPVKVSDNGRDFVDQMPPSASEDVNPFRSRRLALPGHVKFPAVGLARPDLAGELRAC